MGTLLHSPQVFSVKSPWAAKECPNRDPLIFCVVVSLHGSISTGTGFLPRQQVSKTVNRMGRFPLILSGIRISQDTRFTRNSQRRKSSHYIFTITGNLKPNRINFPTWEKSATNRQRSRIIIYGREREAEFTTFISSIKKSDWYEIYFSSFVADAGQSAEYLFLCQHLQCFASLEIGSYSCLNNQSLSIFSSFFGRCYNDTSWKCFHGLSRGEAKNNLSFHLRMKPYSGPLGLSCAPCDFAQLLPPPPPHHQTFPLINILIQRFKSNMG